MHKKIESQDRRRRHPPLACRRVVEQPPSEVGIDPRARDERSFRSAAISARISSRRATSRVRAHAEVIVPTERAHAHGRPRVVARVTEIGDVRAPSLDGVFAREVTRGVARGCHGTKRAVDALARELGDDELRQVERLRASSFQTQNT